MNSVFINGQWVASENSGTFHAYNPLTGDTVGEDFPVSSWADCEKAMLAAAEADEECRDWPAARFADFIEAYVEEIIARTDDLVETAHQETGLPAEGRLRNGELQRTINQLKLAAEACRSEQWKEPVTDEANGLFARQESLGPALLIGPNNFPYAYNSIAGGDFAAAVAAGNPVIAKSHPLHPNTSRIFAEAVEVAMKKTDMPSGFVQMLYHMEPEDGLNMIRDSHIAAVSFTGGKPAGMAIKQAADESGTPVYLEMSSLNPVFLHPNALKERASDIAGEFLGSNFLGCGQFCTNPGLLVAIDNEDLAAFLSAVTENYSEADPGVMLSSGGVESYHGALQKIKNSGAEVLCTRAANSGAGAWPEATLLKISGSQFLEAPSEFQEEAFGPSSLVVAVESIDQMVEVATLLHGNLTAGQYIASNGEDDETARHMVSILRRKAGRLLVNRMPTGVAVSPAMNHGGPYPATGHPRFSAVGFPASIARFTKLTCYDHVPENLRA